MRCRARAVARSLGSRKRGDLYFRAKTLGRRGQLSRVGVGWKNTRCVTVPLSVCQLSRVGVGWKAAAYATAAAAQSEQARFTGTVRETARDREVIDQQIDSPTDDLS